MSETHPLAQSFQEYQRSRKRPERRYQEQICQALNRIHPFLTVEQTRRGKAIIPPYLGLNGFLAFVDTVANQMRIFEALKDAVLLDGA